MQTRTYLQKGLTLIEILVSVVILTTVIGIGVAGYNNFNENQKVKQAALTVKNNLRFAQEKANSAIKPNTGGVEENKDCYKLQLYRFLIAPPHQHLNDDPATYEISARCSCDPNDICDDTAGPGSNLDFYDSQIYKLPSSVFFTEFTEETWQPNIINPDRMLFNVVGSVQRITYPGTISIQNETGSIKYKLVTNAFGNIEGPIKCNGSCN